MNGIFEFSIELRKTFDLRKKKLMQASVIIF